MNAFPMHAVPMHVRRIVVPLTVTLVVGTGLAAPAYAAELRVGVEIPQLNVAEYHRPYVAVWIEGADQKVAANLAVWYQQRGNSEGHGTKWLPDLRQWWRRSGRTLKLPVDGVSGPTKPAGTHTIAISDRDPRLAGLAAGDYTLVVEAAREVGGRELLKVPFTWAPKPKAQNGSAKGGSELGTITLAVKP